MAKSRHELGMPLSMRCLSAHLSLNWLMAFMRCHSSSCWIWSSTTLPSAGASLVLLLDRLEADLWEVYNHTGLIPHLECQFSTPGRRCQVSQL